MNCPYRPNIFVCAARAIGPDTQDCDWPACQCEAPPDDDCPEAIAQWAAFGEREDNWWQRLHDSDGVWAERNGGQRERADGGG
jgi:hypothetical protein